MTRYQLAKLVQWAGTLNSRKRLQKVVYLLQGSGCPIEADYILHHYGPYSQEVARLSDEMVQVGLLKESAAENKVGLQYSYNLGDPAAQGIAELESSPQGKRFAKEISPYERRAKELLKTDLSLLEVASTMAYFRRQGHDWADSVERTCKFKGLDASRTKFIEKAEQLAREFVA